MAKADVARIDLSHHWLRVARLPPSSTQRRESLLWLDRPRELTAVVSERRALPTYARDQGPSLFSILPGLLRILGLDRDGTGQGLKPPSCRMVSGNHRRTGSDQQLVSSGHGTHLVKFIDGRQGSLREYLQKLPMLVQGACISSVSRIASGIGSGKSGKLAQETAKVPGPANVDS